MTSMTAEQVKRMTIEDLIALPDLTVGTAITAHFLEMDRWNVTLAARQGTLPVENHFSGNRLHVVKRDILRYLGYSAQ